MVDTHSGLILPSGWKLKTIVGQGARGKKIVYYESPSGYLYRSPESVLSHMRTSGQYSRQQIAEFESQVAEMEERKNTLGQQGTKRKMEDITQTRDTYQYNRILDLHKALKDISVVKRIKSEPDEQVLRPCKVSLPRLTSEDLNLQYSEVQSKKSESHSGLKLEDMKLRHKTYVEIFDESFVPEGWKVIDIPHYMPQNEGITISMRRFVSPKGLSYSRTQACAFLEKKKDQISFEIMRKGLLSDGWGQNDQFPIPDRFYFRRHYVNQSTMFVTPDWGILKGMKKYKEYLEKHKFDHKYIENIKHLRKKVDDDKDPIENKILNEDQIVQDSDNPEDSHFTDIFKKIVESEEEKDDPNCLIEDMDDDASFPEGWKVTHLGKVVIISGPNGNKFSSRRHALEFMLKSGEEPTSIVKVWRTLSKEGWEEGGNLLPAGWRVSQNAKLSKFLNREMKILVNHDEVLKYLKSDESYSETDIQNFVKWTRTQSKADVSNSTVSWNFHPDLPKGWKRSGDLSGVKYKNPLGTIFEDRIAAIDHMISEVYKPDEIFKLWDTLSEEGWVLDTNLPTGWRRKSVNSGDSFLSPMMKVFKSRTALVQHILTSSEFTPNEVARVKMLLGDEDGCRSIL